MARSRTIPVAALIVWTATSCALAPSPRPPILIGEDWQEAAPQAERWMKGSARRHFSIQDLDRERQRVYPALDSLILADVYRHAGLDSPRLRAFPPAPEKASVLCSETYIFYLRGNQIVGVEYRAVESNGAGGYRQRDDAVGESPAAPPGGS